MNYLRYHIVIIGVFLFANTSLAQLKIIEFSKIDSLQKKQPKICVVFIHTNWCKYCALMQNTTFKNDNIIKTLR